MNDKVMQYKAVRPSQAAPRVTAYSGWNTSLRATEEMIQAKMRQVEEESALPENQVSEAELEAMIEEDQI